MTNPDRLTGLDASFLAVEDAGPHMHVGSVMLFEGPAPAYVDLLAALEARLHLVPRYRQKLAYPPLQAGRPVWVDDPHFNPRYHLRHTGLPTPAGSTSCGSSRAASSRSAWTAPSRCGRCGWSTASATSTSR